MQLFIIQTLILFVLVFTVFYLIINRSLKLEKRISKYSIVSIKNNDISLFDILFNTYNKMIYNLSKKLKKIHFFNEYSLRYNKYITYEANKTKDKMDYVSNKIYIGLLFLIITFIFKSFDIVSLFIGFFFGFYLMDIGFMVYNFIKKKRIEQDLLNAIIIMNNAFRSGNSTMQAIEIVSQELKGPISQEFRKMHLEINYGLSLDTVFERFSKRVDLEEVSYITSSLNILNKTGGNIIKVFSSIEKMLFDKRKLKHEMNSLTSSSMLTSCILLSMPFIFVFIISLLNNSYFLPLLTTALGRIILGVIILLYIIYIIVVVKIMMVRYDK